MIVYLHAQKDNAIHNEPRENVNLPKVGRPLFDHRAGHILYLVYVIINMHTAYSAVFHSVVSKFFLTKHEFFALRR